MRGKKEEDGRKGGKTYRPARAKWPIANVFMLNRF